jgi:hypothetical protein
MSNIKKQVDNPSQKRDRGGKKLKKFYPMTEKIIDRILSLNLSAAELRLWLYCLKLDPWGDRFVSLPPLEKVLQDLNIGVASFYRAKKRLQDAQLFQFKESIAVCNSLGSKAIITDDKAIITDDNLIITDDNLIITDDNLIITDDNLIITDDNRTSLKSLQRKASGSPQTNILNTDLIHTLSDPAPHPKQPKSEKKANNENSQTANSTKNLPSEKEQHDPYLVEKDIALEKIAPPCSIVETRKTTVDPYWNNRGKNIQERLNPKNNLANGEWCLDGKLDPNFHEWFAKKWLEWFGDRYRGDIHAAKADVLAHFYNQPEKLPLRWMQYSGEFGQRYQNAKQVIQSGGYFDEAYENRLKDNVRSLTNQLPSELNPIASRPIKTTDRPTIEDNNYAALPPAEDWKKNIPDAEIVDNVEAYKPFIPPKLPDLSADYKKGTLSELRKKLASKLSMPEAKIEDRDLKKIDLLNEWLKDPILRQEAIAKIMSSDNLTVEYDECGEVLGCRLISAEGVAL